MSERQVKTTLLNMCMVYNSSTNEVLVQDKVPKKSGGWGGITFPGGHVEPGESIIASVIREVKEETGLIISNVESCGLVDWENKEDHSRWLIFLYKTSSFTGQLLNETEEGMVYWVDKKDLPAIRFAPDFSTYLKLFFGNKTEAYGVFTNGSSEELIICE